MYCSTRLNAEVGLHVHHMYLVHVYTCTVAVHTMLWWAEGTCTCMYMDMCVHVCTCSISPWNSRNFLYDVNLGASLHHTGFPEWSIYRIQYMYIYTCTMHRLSSSRNIALYRSYTVHVHLLCNFKLNKRQYSYVLCSLGIKLIFSSVAKCTCPTPMLLVYIWILYTVPVCI